ncbi:Tn3 family transposase [Streptomyces sp. NPDC000349]|uniref:Tn3 family transposase n=1 Tax=Streptomyces sp. NPDC000349 TaxID=3154249 RepID=UPI00336A351E
MEEPEAPQHRFSQWVGFGNQGVIADNDPVEQEKAMKFNALLTNSVVFHNALDIAEIVRQLLEEGWEIDPEDLAQVSPYLTEHIRRFGEYSTHELGLAPDAYDPKLTTSPRCASRVRRGTIATARRHDFSHYGRARSPVTSGSNKPLVSA